MIKINLIPKEILDKEVKRLRATQVTIGLSAFSVVLVLTSMAHYFRALHLEGKLREDQDKLKKLEAIVAQVEQLEQTASAVRARLNVIVDLVRSRPLYPHFMEDIVRSLPSGVWLVSLTTQNEGLGLRVNLSAKSTAREDIAAWLRTLESSDRFHDPVLGPIATSESVGEGTTHTFTITVKYTPPPST